ncbi:hypothetical protein [Alistipes indistinctus]|uniref:hypothetical protein n=1 Tax=Alistipes indistinctus TaxID=626932 RepID=UPI0026DC1862|nr:hypothetical protein [Alistipes indistinctus]
METDKQLAAIALFRELYTANQDAYGVLAKLITYAAHKTTHYCNSIEEIKELLVSEYDYSIPSSVIQYVLTKRLKLEPEAGQYIIQPNGEGNVSIALQKVNQEYDNILNLLCKFIECSTKCELTDNAKKDVVKAFCEFILDNSSNNYYATLISKFIIENAQDQNLTDSLNKFKEGVVLYTGLKYSSEDLGEYGWKNHMILYLDTEIIFSAIGYNGEIYQEIFNDFYDLAAEINRKRKTPVIKLKYFQTTRDEILSYFEKAADIVKGKELLMPGKSAMLRIVEGKAQKYQIKEELARLDVFLKKKNIELDSRDDFYTSENKPYNIESIEASEYCDNKYGKNANIDLKQLNYINILRKGNNEKSFDKTVYWLVTGNYNVMSMGMDSEIKTGHTSLTTTLSFLINRFWFKQNKGFGKDTTFPSSFKVVTQAQLALASYVNGSLIAHYEELKNSNKDQEETTAVYLALRDNTATPDDINIDVVNSKLEFIDNYSIDRVVEEQAKNRLRAEKAEKELAISDLRIKQNNEQIALLEKRIEIFEAHKAELQKEKEEKKQRVCKKRRTCSRIICYTLYSLIVTCIVGIIVLCFQYNEILVRWGSGAISLIVTIIILIRVKPIKKYVMQISEQLACKFVRPID